MTDIKSSIDLWRAHFNAIFNGDESNNSANEMIRPSRPTTLDNTALVASPDRFNKDRGYDGFPAELFKAGGDELVSCMHHLLYNIWSLESMRSDWSLSVLCPVLKKDDATIYSSLIFLHNLKVIFISILKQLLIFQV